MAEDKNLAGKPPEAGSSEGKPKFDPFKAEDPVLPGVPRKTAGAPASAATGFKLDFKDPKVMAAGGAGLAVLLLLMWFGLGSSKPKAGVSSSPAASASAETPAATSSAVAAPSPPAGPAVVSLPGVVGTIEEFPLAWSTKKILVQKATGRVPALIIRLPGGSPRRAETYWGLLLTSPYGRCELEYVDDLKRIADDFGYRARHPMVVDPCNLTVFNPLAMGDVGGIIARGEVVQGTTIRPPLAMELKIDGNRIMVLQTE